MITMIMIQMAMIVLIGLLALPRDIEHEQHQLGAPQGPGARPGLHGRPYNMT